MSIDADIEVEETSQGKKLEKALEELDGKEVEVGFFAGQDTYSDESGDVDVAEVAGFNEFGTSSIPERPFLRNSFDLHKSEIESDTDKISAAMLDGKMTVKTGLQRIGEKQRKHINDEILRGSYTPNAASTVKKKGSSHPLIASGQMNQSVHYMVDGELID